jgi:hypothetical protein
MLTSVFGRVGINPGGTGWSRTLALTACVLLVPLRVPAQMFIRVAPPSVDEQNQAPTTAMPNTPGAASTNGPRESVLSGGQVVEMVDANGNQVKPSNPGDWRNWRPTFYGNLQLAFDDNIFIQEHNEKADFITNISPGIVLGWGDYQAELPRLGQFQHQYEVPANDLTASRFLYVDYHPTFEIFASNTQEDTVDEDVVAAGSYQFSRLTLQGNAQYQTLSATDLDVGDRVRRTSALGTVTGTYDYNDKTSVDSTFSATNLRYSGGYESSIEVVDQTFLSTQYGPKTQLAAGVGLGYLIPNQSANQFYEQLLGRVRWSGTDKLNGTGIVGVEVRESNDSNKVNGIFNLTLNYLPFDGTIVIFDAERLTEPSEAELGQDIVLTNVNIQARQRFLGRLYATGLIGYRNANYEHISNTKISRDDNYVELSLGVGTDVTKYAGIQLAWRFADDSSTLAGRTFNDEQVVFQFDVLY